MKRLLFSCLAVLCTLISHAQQLRVTWPYDGAVFQRGSDNTAPMSILGTFNSQLFKDGEYTLTAKFDKLSVSTGVVTQANALSFQLGNNGGGAFGGITDLAQGWYRLTVKATPNTGENLTRVGTKTVSIKVGVGEVFMISGQSNAQGLENYVPDYDNELKVATQPLPSMDGVRVQPTRFTDLSSLTATLTKDPTAYKGGNKLMYIGTMASVANNQAQIAPMGNSLWCWAALGEKLATKFNNEIPIAFFNAAWGGTTITNWATTAINPAATPLGFPVSTNPRFSEGGPYGVLRNALQFYGSMYGLRAILWQQGESDTWALTGNWPDLNSGGVIEK